MTALPPRTRLMYGAVLTATAFVGLYVSDQLETRIPPSATTDKSAAGEQENAASGGSAESKRGS
jgi:hypothetical protein